MWAALMVPVLHVNTVVTIGSLPAAVRRRLGARWTARQQRELDLYCALVRGAFALLPRQYSYFPRAAQGFKRAAAA